MRWEPCQAVWFVVSWRTGIDLTELAAECLVHKNGNISFGTHLARNHTLFYRSFGATGRLLPTTVPGGQYSFSMAAQIVGGEGAFQNAQGMLTYLGYGSHAMVCCRILLCFVSMFTLVFDWLFG